MSVESETIHTQQRTLPLTTMHKAEFDQLLQMIPRGSEPPPLPPVMPLPQPGQRR